MAHQLWHTLRASGTNKQILFLFLPIKFLGKRLIINLRKSDLCQSLRWGYHQMHKCSRGVVWSEIVAPCTAVQFPMQPALKHLENTHRALKSLVKYSESFSLETQKLAYQGQHCQKCLLLPCLLILLIFPHSGSHILYAEKLLEFMTESGTHKWLLSTFSHRMNTRLRIALTSRG